MIDELHSEELKSLHDKREILERLLAFTQQLNELAGSLDLVKEIAKPSQQFNQRIYKVMVELIKKLDVLPTDKLKAHLSKTNKEVQLEIKRMLVLSSMTEAEFIEHFKKHSTGCLKKSVELLLKEILEFQKKAQINLALRHILAKRGALLEPCALPISQEKIGQKVEALRSQENVCKKKVIEKIQELIKDTDLMLNKDKFPDDLKSQLQVVRDNLTQQLKKIESGVAIEDIMYAIDAFDISDETMSLSAASNKDTDNTHPVNKESDPTNENDSDTLEDDDSNTIKKPKPYLIQLILDFGIWLVAPWRVSWRTIRAKSRYRVSQYKASLKTKLP